MILGPVKYHLLDFLCYEGEGGRILNGIKHFSIDNLSIFTPNDFTLKKEIFLLLDIIANIGHIPYIGQELASLSGDIGTS